MSCSNVRSRIRNGYYYLLGENLDTCYTAGGYVKTSDNTRCIKCDDGYEVSNRACVEAGSNPGSGTGDNDTEPVVEVKPAKNDTVTNAATQEVSKLVDKIVEGKSVSGIDNTLKTKIENAVEEEKTVVVEIETNNVQEAKVSNDAKKVNKKITNTEKVAAYYDVGVAVKVDDQKVGNVTQLENKITISVPIPTSLPAVPSGYTRKYKIIRVHNGVAEEITPSVSGNNLVFKTDKFST